MANRLQSNISPVATDVGSASVAGEFGAPTINKAEGAMIESTVHPSTSPSIVLPQGSRTLVDAVRAKGVHKKPRLRRGFRPQPKRLKETTVPG
jgi:hypothetical protein